VPQPIVEFRGVSKNYPIYSSPSARLKELLCLNRISFHHDFAALDDVTFEIERGETFCIVGENGSGKSTLLQIVAGILHPSRGDVVVRGRVAALLELGTGFNPEFTGRQNVYMNAAILGLSRQEIDAKFSHIEEFAEIGEFIDQPVKTYSSGMGVRLAFSVAIHVEPEILLVDEALSVGDIYFRQRCLRKVHEMREAGVTILFVSHAIAEVKALGDRAMWLEAGRIREIGNTDAVVTRYLAAMVEKDNAYLAGTHRKAQDTAHEPVKAPEIVETIPNIDHRFGDGRAEVMGIAIAQPHRPRLRRHQYGARSFRSSSDGWRRHLHGRFSRSGSRTVPFGILFFTRYRRWNAAFLPHVRLGGQRHRPPDGACRRGGVRSHSSGVPRGTESLSRHSPASLVSCGANRWLNSPESESSRAK
jgi:lipopolysaccharide transport system ATP-binding protein